MLQAITLLIFPLQTSRSVILDRNGEILLLRASRVFLRFPYLHKVRLSVVCPGVCPVVRPVVRPGVRPVVRPVVRPEIASSTTRTTGPDARISTFSFKMTSLPPKYFFP